MKSLKDTKSYKQMTTDYMLGISLQPDNTCPLIDALIYEGNRRSKIYDLKIDYEPHHLRVDTSDLIKRIGQLESWAEDIICKYEEVEDIINHQDPEDLEYTQSLVDNINSYINNNRNYEMNELASKINDIIDNWIDLNSAYFNTEHSLEKVKKELNDIEIKIDQEDPDDEYNDLERLNSELNDAQYNVADYEKQLDKLKDDFDYDISRSFETICGEFSDLLESIRQNNDGMRKMTTDLKKFIFPHLRNDYLLDQPIDFLKKLEDGSNDEISIGVVDKSIDNYCIIRFSKYLKDNGVVLESQEKIFDRLKNVNDIVDLLQHIGYKKIFYYDNYKDFLNDPNNYKMINLKTQNKLISKPKI